MSVALLVDDRIAGELLATLLARADIEARVYRRPRPTVDLARHLAALRTAHDDIVAVGAPIAGTRHLEPRPSLAAWLTRDPEANRAVLGTDAVPEGAQAEAWLQRLVLGTAGAPRAYSAALDGRALVDTVDLGLVAAAAPELRALLAALRPAWGAAQPFKRGRGRPPGIQLFAGTGYALCLELLHQGAGAELTTGQLVDALGRSKTPVLRMIGEAERRGYVRRGSPRGPLRLVRPDRLLEDLVTAVRAERVRRPPRVLPLAADRDPAGLPARVAAFLAERGRVMALTGGAAVVDLGGDALIGGPVVAYARIDGAGATVADGYRDAQHPRLVIVEPQDDAVLHRMRPGTPAAVVPWQAVIDLLASDSAREREIGDEVRGRLERPR